MAQKLGEWSKAPAEATGLYRAMLLRSASMYSEIQRERADIGGLMARPEYREWNPELIKPKKLLNPVKASRSHQELHRELLMNHRSWKTHHREKMTTPLSSSKSGKTCAESPRRREHCRVPSIQFLPLTLALLNQKALEYRDARKADLRGWQSLGNWGSPHPIGKSL
ncbi:actin-associated protein FAM107A isoform X2 [Chionomys nivalis]|uniref:actin-associated protein FAM107A isoform X2 n=1 Tax=Chionomys nivalis TaxID=269649 RepID=UPI00259AA3DD|nr:actin-associated protein FAM107A isoform X2 [Chionomys nivalis]